MIEPGQLDITIVRGADFSLVFDIQIDDTILSLTGATVQSQVRRQPMLSSELIADFTVTVNAAHEITLALTDVATTAMNYSKGFYDVLVTDSAGVDTYYLQGDVIILGSATVKV